MCWFAVCSVGTRRGREILLGAAGAATGGGRVWGGSKSFSCRAGTPDADILGLMHAADGAHGLWTRRPRPFLRPARPRWSATRRWATGGRLISDRQSLVEPGDGGSHREGQRDPLERSLELGPLRTRAPSNSGAFELGPSGAADQRARGDGGSHRKGQRDPLERSLGLRRLRTRRLRTRAIGSCRPTGRAGHDHPPIASAPTTSRPSTSCRPTGGAGHDHSPIASAPPPAALRRVADQRGRARG